MDAFLKNLAIANVWGHGVKAGLHLEALWDCNVTITTRLVDTGRTPMLLKKVLSAASSQAS